MREGGRGGEGRGGEGRGGEGRGGEGKGGEGREGGREGDIVCVTYIQINTKAIIKLIKTPPVKRTPLSSLNIR